MQPRKMRKRILSIMLAIVLCVGTWAGDIQSVMAEETTEASEQEEAQQPEEADNPSENGEASEQEEAQQPAEADNQSETDVATEVDESVDSVSGTEGNDDSEDAVSPASELEESVDTSSLEEEESVDTEGGSDLEENADTEESDLGEENPNTEEEEPAGTEEESTLETEEETETATETEEETELTEEAVRDSETRTEAVNLLTTNTAEGKTLFEEQIGTDENNTYVKVTATINGTTQTKQYYAGAQIDLSAADTNKPITFEIQTAYSVINGHKDSDDEQDETTDYRNLIEGDYFTVAGIPNVLGLDGDLPPSLTADINGKDVEMVTVTSSTVNDETSITYKFTKNIDKDLDPPYLDIQFLAGMKLTLNKEYLNDSATTKVQLDIPGNYHNITLPQKSSTLPEGIEKTGRLDGDTITWEIAITPDSRSLNGFTITDTLDTTYQELLGVYWGNVYSTPLYLCEYDAAGNKTVKTEAAESLTIEAVSNNQQTISYTFGENETTSSSKKFIVKTRLNDAAEKWRLSGGTSEGTTKQIANNAELAPADNTSGISPMTSSDKVEIESNSKRAVTKGYTQISADVILWKITVNPGKNRIWKADVTDVLPAGLRLIDDTVKISEGEYADVTEGVTTINIMAVQATLSMFVTNTRRARTNW